MPIVHSCSEPGCDVLTMGVFCVEHEDTLAGKPAAMTPLTSDHRSCATPDDGEVHEPELIGLS